MPTAWGSRACRLLPSPQNAAHMHWAERQIAQGRRAWKPLGARLPLTDCWPTQATIWAMLMGEPLLPHWLMIRGLLWRGSVLMHTCAALCHSSRLRVRH